MNQKTLSKDWETLRNKLLTQLENLQYSPLMTNIYRQGLDRIEKFMTAHSETSYSENIGSLYFNEWQAKAERKPHPVRRERAIIHRLNDILAGRDYAKRRTYNPRVCPDCFSKQLAHYSEYLQLQGLKETTVQTKIFNCLEFLEFLTDSGVAEFADIGPKHIYDGFSKSNSKANFSRAVTSLLKFAFAHNYHNADLSSIVPRVRRPQPFPSVYSEEEIRKLFLAIDTSTILGKRDYALLSFAAFLGLRKSDICNLTLDNIDFERKIIRLVQQKTSIPLEIYLLPEVEASLLVYMNEVTPANNNSLIFRSTRAPYEPLLARSAHNIAKKYFRLAKINTTGKNIGTHSLRTSLATKLVSENVPYVAIQKILGQGSPESTKHYARIDTKNLRKYALEVPLPTGSFAKRLIVAGGANNGV